MTDCRFKLTTNQNENTNVEVLSLHLPLLKRIQGLCILVLFIVIVSGCSEHQNAAPHANKGVMDFSSWDFKKDGVAELSGEWEFYWKRLLTPDDFQGSNALYGNTYLPLPSFWTDHEKKVPAIESIGYATYRLQLKNISSENHLSLRVSSLLGAYRIWIDGKLLNQNGHIGTDRQEELPGKQKVAIIPLGPTQKPTPETIDIIIQLSNFAHEVGGTLFPLSIGSGKEITAIWDKERLLIIFSTTLLLVMGCYHLIFYFFRRKDPSLLYFSIFCLLWMMQFFSNYAHQWMLTLLFPGHGLLTGYYIAHVCYIFHVSFFLLFLRSIYPDEKPFFLPGILLVVGSILSLIFLSSDRFNQYVIVAAHAITLIGGLWGLAIICRAMRLKRQSARILFMGCIVMGFTGINDVLSGLRLINTGFYTYIGLTFFIASQACALALRFSRAFTTTENLSVELQEKNIALSRLDTLKDEFIANTSHELCTPLSGIIGIAESMLAGATGSLPPQATRNLEMLAASGKRLNGLVDNILDFSRLKNRDLILKLKPVDLMGLTEIVLKLLAPLVDPKGLTLVNSIPDNCPPVLADENRLQQILYNLLGNGIKFTESGSVTVSATAKDGHIRVDIIDTGIGIPKDKQDEIFLYFEQVNSSTSREYEGTGLGLPITKQLVELHNGNIGIDSQIEKGTTIWFTLPLADRDAEPLSSEFENSQHTTQYLPLPAIVSYPDEIDVPTPPDRTQEKILVVDDEPVNLQVAVNHLTQAGFNVHTAEGGAEALNIINSENKPDLVLLDIMMPHMNGYEVCQTLRDKHGLSDLPVVMLTAKNRLLDLV